MSYYLPLTVRGHINESIRHLKEAEQKAREDGNIERANKLHRQRVDSANLLKGWKESNVIHL